MVDTEKAVIISVTERSSTCSFIDTVPVDDVRICQASVAPEDGSLPRERAFEWSDFRLAVGKSVVASKPELDALHGDIHLPDLRGTMIYRILRWNLVSTYKRVFALTIMANVVAFIIQLRVEQSSEWLSIQLTSTAAAVNLALAIVVRHEHFVNLLFHISSSFKTCQPLVMRRFVAKVYCYGGLHSGCSITAVGWYILFAISASRHLYITPTIGPMAVALAYFILLVLAGLLCFAHPALRFHAHNAFETTHRFGGWIIIICLWTQTILLAKDMSRSERQSLGKQLLRTPTFWCLVLVSATIVYPWMRLRRYKVSISERSKHAMRLSFQHPNPQWGSTIRLSRNPIIENHAFAVIPEQKPSQGFSIVISNAGDWTNDLISNPPDYVWVKGAPCLGVIRIAQTFRPVLIVATGSGIGPCLSFFRGCPDHPCRVLWSAPSPDQNFGQAIVDNVWQADPWATIIDTRRAGRPDLLKLAYKMYQDHKIEAIVVISNAIVTKWLVYELEARGVPAYGPIFDS